MLMLFVTTPGDPIIVRAKMDFVQMEKLAEVTIAIYCVSIYQSEWVQGKEPAADIAMQT